MPIWGLDKGEVRGAWRELGVPNLYYMMGECRVFGEGFVIMYSHYLKAPFIYLDIIPNILHYVSGTDGIHRETHQFFWYPEIKAKEEGIFGVPYVAQEP